MNPFVIEERNKLGQRQTSLPYDINNIKRVEQQQEDSLHDDKDEVEEREEEEEEEEEGSLCEDSPQGGDIVVKGNDGVGVSEPYQGMTSHDSTLSMHTHNAHCTHTHTHTHTHCTALHIQDYTSVHTCYFTAHHPCMPLTLSRRVFGDA